MTRSVRVRFLLGHAYGRGGAVRSTLNTAAAMAERGHDVEIVSLVKRRARPAYPLPDAVRIRILTPSRRLLAPGWTSPRRLLRRLARIVLQRIPSRIFPPGDKWYSSVSLFTDVALGRYLRRQHDCVLIGTNPGLNLALARLAPADAITIGQEHLHLARRAASRRNLMRASYPALDAVVTLTEDDAEQYRALLPSTYVEAIPNAVPEGRSHQTTDVIHASTVVAAGRLTAQKGFDLLIRAWAVASRDNPGWRLHIHGTGPDRRLLRNLIVELGVEERTTLMGHTDDMSSVFTSAGLFVLSSRYEGFPMVMLEAMSHGLPIVAFDCPTGPAELVEDGVTGRLVSPGATAELATTMSDLLRQPELRDRMGQAAKARSRQWDRGRIAGRWEDLFRRLEERRRDDRLSRLQRLA